MTHSSQLAQGLSKFNVVDQSHVAECATAVLLFSCHDDPATRARLIALHQSLSSVIVMDYSALIWAALLGWSLFDRLPPATTWLGAPLIVGAGLLIAWREQQLNIARNRSHTIEPS